MPADPHRERTVARLGAAVAGAVLAPRCHVYLRVSSPDQDLDVGPDGRPVRDKERKSKDDRDREVKRSLDTQEQECRAFAARKGWHVVAVYREIYTSQAFWDRPELAKLRDAIVRSEVDVMLVLKTERLGGTSPQVHALQHLLERYSGRLAFVQHEFEDTPIGRIGQTVLVEFNTFRLENLREQFNRAKRARVEGGRALHGPQEAYGCVWADEARTHYRFLPRASEAWTTLRWAYLEVIGGASLNGVAKALTRRRVPAPSGGAVWYQKSLSELLKNPLYCGRPVSLRHKQHVEQRAGKRVRRAVVTPEGAGPALRPPEGEPPVTPEEFARAQAALAAGSARQREQRGTRQAPAGDWLLLGGYAVCALCEQELRAHYARWGQPDPATGARQRTPRYDCKANRYGQKVCAHPVSIGREALELDVWLELQELLARPGEVERVLRAYRAASGASTADRARAAAEREALRGTLLTVEAEARRLSEEIAKTTDAYVREVLTASLATRGTARTALLADLRAAEGKLEAVEQALAEVDGFQAECAQLLGLLREPDAAGRLFRLALKLFRPVAVVQPANPADPDRPWLGRGTKRVAVTFPPAVPGAVRALLREVHREGDEVRASETYQVWCVPLAPTPGAPRLRLTPQGVVLA